MIYLKVPDETGDYINESLERFTILEASLYIDTPEGRNVGCLIYDSIEEAAEYYGLTYEPIIIEHNQDGGGI